VLVRVKSEARLSFVARGKIVAGSAGVSNGHGPAEAIGRLSHMTTDQKGAIAEAAIALTAIKLNLDVYKPVAEGGRCDLILGIGPELLRLQCKWAQLQRDVLIVRCYTFRRTREGYCKTTYSASEVDAIAAYSADLDRCFIIPIELAARRPTLALRIAPTRNNQRRGINWADDFDFVATLRRHQGAVAQLGERRRGTPKATGSSPVGSIF
jgi:PD-(D/E)XK endonuclease